jgi:hypothetical protein
MLRRANLGEQAKKIPVTKKKIETTLPSARGAPPPLQHQVVTGIVLSDQRLDSFVTTTVTTSPPDPIDIS